MRKKFPCCQICGEKNKLHVHHIFPRHLYPQFSLNVNNLIVLCDKCHTKIHIHTIWGEEWMKENNKEQYDWVMKMMKLVDQ